MDKKLAVFAALIVLAAADASSQTADQVIERFIARGRVVRPGKKLMVCLGEVFAEERGRRKQVALMTASMMVMDTASGLRD